jgi:hypothetical protein
MDGLHSHSELHWSFLLAVVVQVVVAVAVAVEVHAVE